MSLRVEDVDGNLSGIKPTSLIKSTSAKSVTLENPQELDGFIKVIRADSLVGNFVILGNFIGGTQLEFKSKNEYVVLISIGGKWAILSGNAKVV